MKVNLFDSNYSLLKRTKMMRALMKLRILAKPPEIQGFQTISHSYQNTFDRGVVFASFPLASGIGAGFVGPI